MATAVEQSIQAIVFVVQVVPIGTNLGLVRLLWAMMNGSFLRSRGAIFPALLLNGFTPVQIRRSWAAFAYGSWKIEELLEIWCIYVASKNEWREHCIAGLRVVSIDITGFWRPRLKGWPGKHYHHWAGKALPAVVMGVMVTSGRIHGRRIPLLHTLLRCKPETSEAEFRLELLKEAASRPDSQEVKVLDGGFKISEIQVAKLSGYVVRMANNCTAHRNQLPDYKGKGRYPFSFPYLEADLAVYGGDERQRLWVNGQKQSPFSEVRGQRELNRENRQWRASVEVGQELPGADDPRNQKLSLIHI